MGKLIAWIFVIGLFVAIVWGTTMLGKFLSYKFFYESSVKNTIYETVNKECLR